MINLKNLDNEGGSEATYKEFINQVTLKLHELELEYNKSPEELPAKLEYINLPLRSMQV